MAFLAMKHETHLSPSSATPVAGSATGVQASDTILSSFNPATNERVWQGKVGDPIVAARLAQAAWPRWSARALPDRLEIVRNFSNRIKHQSEELAQLMSLETGRPMWDCREEVEAMGHVIDYSLRAYSDRTAQRRIEGRSTIQRSAVRHKPHGVIVIITPYSAPGLIAFGQMIPALIAGNAVIWKPSERTPAFADAIGALAMKAQFPDGLLQIVQGRADVAKALITADQVRAVFFSGSAHVGLTLHKQLGGRPDKLLSLDIGGNNPIIAWDIADLQAGAIQIARSAFQSSGQKCTAARRLIVKDDIADVLVGEVKRIADRLIVGAPGDDPIPFMGPMIDNNTADGLVESFLALMSHGGRPIKHLLRPDLDMPFIAPGMIDVTQMTERPDLELFGPLLQIIRVRTFEEAMAEANNTRFHRTAALIGGTREQFDLFWANSRAGMVHWNNVTHEVNGNGPVAGNGLSGNHRAGGYYTADSVAYPVQSAENDQPRGLIGIGLKDEEYVPSAA